VRLQTYMLVRFGMSVVTGLAFWAFTVVDGLELQRERGVIAFVLNFIPFIGSFVATLLPTLFAAAQFESIYAALVVFIGLNLIQFVIGSYIEPRVAGTAVSVSPFMVLFAVFLGHALGCGRRIYRRADPDRVCNRLRQAAGDPPDRGPAFGRRSDASDVRSRSGSPEQRTTD